MKKIKLNEYRPVFIFFPYFNLILRQQREREIAFSTIKSNNNDMKNNTFTQINLSSVLKNNLFSLNLISSSHLIASKPFANEGEK